MEEVKVIKVKILPTIEQEQILQRTMAEYTRTCNLVSNWIFNNGFEISHHTVSRALYSELRQVSTLPSHMLQNTFRTVCARYKTVQTQLKKTSPKYLGRDGNLYPCKDSNGKRIYKDISWLQAAIQFKNPEADMCRRFEYSFTGDQVSLSTVDGRQRMSYIQNHYEQYFSDNTWKFGTAKLVHKFNRWFLHIPCSREISDTDNSPRIVVGIDRGLSFTITAYDGHDTFFWNGQQYLQIRHKFRKVRQQLQQKNTKSSRRRLRKIGHRENRWMSDVNHKISKTLCEYYAIPTLFALEDLEGVTFEEKNLRCSKQKKADKTSWAHYQLQQYLEYKALAAGHSIITVSPRYTSQRCPVCGRIDKTQRHSTGQRQANNHEYRCACGYRSNDDRNGAINIRELGLKYLNGDKNPKFTKSRTIAIAD